MQEASDVPRLDAWICDAYVEDALEFSADKQRAVIPFAQEAAQAPQPHPSMADPELVEETQFTRVYHVPLTRCYLVVEHARSLDSEIDWGCPTLESATYRDSALRLSGIAKISIPVTRVDIGVFVSTEIAGRLLRKERGPWISERWLNPPA